jgi:hypothetical protein
VEAPVEEEVGKRLPMTSAEQAASPKHIVDFGWCSPHKLILK